MARDSSKLFLSHLKVTEWHVQLVISAVKVFCSTYLGVTTMARDSSKLFLSFFAVGNRLKRAIRHLRHNSIKTLYYSFGGNDNGSWFLEIIFVSFDGYRMTRAARHLGRQSFLYFIFGDNDNGSWLLEIIFVSFDGYRMTRAARLLGRQSFLYFLFGDNDMARRSSKLFLSHLMVTEWHVQLVISAVKVFCTLYLGVTTMARRSSKQFCLYFLRWATDWNVQSVIYATTASNFYTLYLG